MTRCVLSARCEDRWCVGRTWYGEFVCWDNAIVFDWFSNFCLNSFGSFNATFGLHIYFDWRILRSITNFYDFKLWNPEFQIFFGTPGGEWLKKSVCFNRSDCHKIQYTAFVKHRFAIKIQFLYVSIFQWCFWMWW